MADSKRCISRDRRLLGTRIVLSSFSFKIKLIASPATANTSVFASLLTGFSFLLIQIYCCLSNYYIMSHLLFYGQIIDFSRNSWAIHSHPSVEILLSPPLYKSVCSSLGNLTPTSTWTPFTTKLDLRTTWPYVP